MLKENIELKEELEKKVREYYDISLDKDSKKEKDNEKYEV